MYRTAGVRFKPGGKIYDFDCGAFVLNVGDEVIVETEKGLGFGIVTTAPKAIEEYSAGKPLKKVFRKATAEDLEQCAKISELQKEAHLFCQQCIDELKLAMSLFAVEATFDAGRLTFFFTADGRIDFRQLVKMLVKRLHARIEMRQVGIRNQAKMCGGLGRCGREFCCSTFLEKFDPVSIRMAKDQGLSLNPTKISGQCGRLMCCLNFENAVYQEFKNQFPQIGKTVRTQKHTGKILRCNYLQGRVALRLDNNEEVEVGIEEIIKP